MKNNLISEFEITNSKIIKLKRLIEELTKVKIDYCFSLSLEERNYNRSYKDKMNCLYFYNEDVGDMLVVIELDTMKVSSVILNGDEKISLLLTDILKNN